MRHRVKKFLSRLAREARKEFNLGFIDSIRLIHSLYHFLRYGDSVRLIKALEQTCLSELITPHLSEDGDWYYELSEPLQKYAELIRQNT